MVCAAFAMVWLVWGGGLGLFVVVLCNCLAGLGRFAPCFCNGLALICGVAGVVCDGFCDGLARFEVICVVFRVGLVLVCGQSGLVYGWFCHDLQGGLEWSLLRFAMVWCWFLGRFGWFVVRLGWVAVVAVGFAMDESCFGNGLVKFCTGRVWGGLRWFAMVSAMVPGVVGFVEAMSSCVGSKRARAKQCEGRANLGDPKLTHSGAVLMILMSSKAAG